MRHKRRMDGGAPHRQPILPPAKAESVRCSCGADVALTTDGDGRLLEVCSSCQYARPVPVRRTRLPVAPMAKGKRTIAQRRGEPTDWDEPESED